MLERGKQGRIIVRNLDFKITEEKLMEEFRKHGKILEVNLLKNKENKLMGCAFIQFANSQDAKNAIEALNNKMILNRKVKIDFAVSKDRYKSEKKPEIKKDEEEKADKEKPKKKKQKKKQQLDESSENSPIKADKNEDQEMEEQNDGDVTIFIKNLSFDTTDEDLKEHFKQFGPIKYALVVKDKFSGHSKGTGFVKFLKKESAQLCQQQSGQIVLQNFTLEICPSLSRQEVMTMEQNRQDKEPKDSRNMYLMREGTVLAGSTAAEGVSASDMSKRLRLEQIKASMLKNLNRFIARDRLTVHDLPDIYDDDKLRKLVNKWAEVNPKECRVMRENKPSAGNPQGKSKGFGFLSFKSHDEALSVLRKLNNNPKVFAANHRPIVSFSIEDKKVHNIKQKRLQRSLQNNPTFQNKLKAKKMRRSEKKKEKSENQKTDNLEKKTENKKEKPEKVEETENTEDYSGFLSKPGKAVKMRGIFKLKQQSKIHEKSMEKRKKLLKNKKEKESMKKEKLENRIQKKAMKSKLKTKDTDDLASKIKKYKDLLQNNDIARKVKTKKKWYTED